MKFTEAGGIRVLVDVRHDERHMLNLTIDVRDTGIGIAEHKLDRLFRRSRSWIRPAPGASAAPAWGW